jgi:Protein of unknown function (DUF3035)
MMVKQALRITAVGGLVASLLAVAGCGNIGNPIKAITGQIAPPDEFLVIARKPLEMPTGGALPAPTPGTPSPLDPNPQSEAIAALLGSSGARPAPATAPSAGEKVLLASANASAASNEIRVQLETDKVTAAANKPYEPPSLGELLSGSSAKKVDLTNAIDPIAESQRLQREGLLTPSDPQAAAEVPEAERRKPPEPIYPSGRPQSPIKTPGTAPAY